MGHVEDRWMRPKRDDDGKVVINGRGKPVLEPTELYGKGLRYRVRYVDPDGDERSKSFPDRQKKRADDFLIEVESDKREGKYIDPRGVRKTFRQQAENWYKAQSPDPATREVLRSRLKRRIYPTLGDLPLGRIQPATIRDWLGVLEEQKLSENYKLALFTIVSAVLDSAKDDRLIRDNPCQAKTVRRPLPASPQIEVWPESRLWAVRDGLAERFAVIVPLGSGLGLRQGEIFAIAPEDIDRDGLVVTVRRQIKTADGVQMFALPKGGKTRTVPLSVGLLAELDAHMSKFPPVSTTLPWARTDGDPVTANLIVTGEGGRLYSGDLFTKVVWQGGFRNAGIEHRKRADGMHALRHFYASTLLSRGVSIKELADYLGHGDPGFTLRTYTHLVSSSHERARQAVDDIFRPPADDGLEAA
ncbi:site-specific integrase [Nocardia sp. NRRL WC-3656]|uniref:tyrosine-type recombinase/integrase n=1 Tax=Nocardia sp. NRRL WC-3656 TaxID=1463824 RepID=UPI0004C32DCF|nr:site-specific integrase [Nocardia sp. NRRL WC-3656]